MGSSAVRHDRVHYTSTCVDLYFYVLPMINVGNVEMYTKVVISLFQITWLS
jgi:hypothetical protein